MTKNLQKQAGSTHVIIIIILVVVVLGLLGFVFWQSVTKSDNTEQATNITSETPSDQNIQTKEAVPYTNEVIGVKFDYPKEWVKVECDNTYIENPQRTVYFGTNKYGLDIPEGGVSNLCGGGTDFPPQMAIKLVDANAAFDGAYTDVTVDSKGAKKYVLNTSQDDIIRGLEITRYVVEIENGEYIVFSYNRFPEISDDKRDNSQASLQQFTKFVEQDVQFL